MKQIIVLLLKGLEQFWAVSSVVGTATGSSSFSITSVIESTTQKLQH
ncbi:MAG: hypothetical protein ACFFGP_13715 [Promethearchaeota archaeon]